MSLSDPLVLKDSAGTDTNFDVQSLISAKSAADPSGTIRVDRASTATEPRTITVKQQITGKGSTRVRRTLISFGNEQVGATGVSSKLVTNLSWAYPLNGEFVAADLTNALCFICDLVLTTGSLAVDTTKTAALLQGQS